MNKFSMNLIKKIIYTIPIIKLNLEPSEGSQK